MRGQQVHQLGQHLDTVPAIQRQRQLRRQKTVARPDVVAPVRLLEREVLLVPAQLGERRGERNVRRGVRELPPQNLDDRRRLHVHAEEAEVMSGAQSRDAELLFSLGRRGLLDHGLDAI